MYAVIKGNKVTSMVHSEAPTGLNLEGCELVESDINVIGMTYVDGEFVESEKSAEELAIEAQAYLDSTDYIYSAKREKDFTWAEFDSHYEEILKLRVINRAIVSDYNDSL